MPVVLFILAVVWAIYLASWVRSRGDRKGVNSISTFSQHLSVLERTSPYYYGSDFSGSAPTSHLPSGRPTPLYPAVGYVAPQARMSLYDARRRRRTVLVGLASAAVTTLLFVPFLGSFAVFWHLVSDVLLVAYVSLLARTRRLAVERYEKVVYLPHLTAGAEPQLLLHQSAN